MKKKKMGAHPIRSNKPTPLDRMIGMLEGEAETVLSWRRDDTTLVQDYDLTNASLLMKAAALSLRRVRSAG